MCGRARIHPSQLAFGHAIGAFALNWPMTWAQFAPSKVTAMPLWFEGRHRASKTRSCREYRDGLVSEHRERDLRTNGA